MIVLVCVRFGELFKQIKKIKLLRSCYGRKRATTSYKCVRIKNVLMLEFSFDRTAKLVGRWFVLFKLVKRIQIFGIRNWIFVKYISKKFYCVFYQIKKRVSFFIHLSSLQIAEFALSLSSQNKIQEHDYFFNLRKKYSNKTLLSWG